MAVDRFTLAFEFDEFATWSVFGISMSLDEAIEKSVRGETISHSIHLRLKEKAQPSIRVEFDKGMINWAFCFMLQASRN